MLKLKEYLNNFNPSDIISISFGYSTKEDNSYSREFTVSELKNNILAESSVVSYNTDNLSRGNIKASVKICFTEYILTKECIVSKAYLNKYAIKKFEIDKDIVLFNYINKPICCIGDDFMECTDIDDFKNIIDSIGEDYYNFSEQDKILTLDELESLVGEKDFKYSDNYRSIESLDENPKAFLQEFLKNENGKYKYYIIDGTYNPEVHCAVDLLNKKFNECLIIDDFTIKNAYHNITLKGYKSYKNSELLKGIFQLENTDKYILLNLNSLYFDSVNPYREKLLGKYYTIDELTESTEEYEIVWLN
ncbi:hypothetical protein [Clostridium perfringens]|uniref:hypothetical protein n=1 Tax=Clostridium perfringens TaxID=1502 RepID=UPI001570783B|nr:hypothetical protein [Clostridium perfringens]MDU7143009.1 hypothetical protein [Anaerococcus vaginalis]MDU7942661.1 hypothetical protein [Streptococcus salivarius]MDU7977632.1 hypothetical protein [Clostridioides difficile]EGT0690648.1 hypothetical protein [Clostridium perfringens]EGT0693997.1 hypothetical protein [Clostridium perfringens]